jgi:hypothetical protein
MLNRSLVLAIDGKWRHQSICRLQFYARLVGAFSLSLNYRSETTECVNVAGKSVSSGQMLGYGAISTFHLNFY